VNRPVREGNVPYLKHKIRLLRSWRARALADCSAAGAMALSRFCGDAASAGAGGFSAGCGCAVSAAGAGGFSAGGFSADGFSVDGFSAGGFSEACAWAFRGACVREGSCGCACSGSATTMHNASDTAIAAPRRPNNLTVSLRFIAAVMGARRDYGTAA